MRVMGWGVAVMACVRGRDEVYFEGEKHVETSAVGRPGVHIFVDVVQTRFVY